MSKVRDNKRYAILIDVTFFLSHVWVNQSSQLILTARQKQKTKKQKQKQTNKQTYKKERENTLTYLVAFYTILFSSGYNGDVKISAKEDVLL